MSKPEVDFDIYKLKLNDIRKFTPGYDWFRIYGRCLGKPFSFFIKGRSCATLWENLIRNYINNPLNKDGIHTADDIEQLAERWWRHNMGAQPKSVVIPLFR